MEWNDLSEVGNTDSINKGEKKNTFASGEKASLRIPEQHRLRAAGGGRKLLCLNSQDIPVSTGGMMVGCSWSFLRKTWYAAASGRAPGPPAI